MSSPTTQRKRSSTEDAGSLSKRLSRPGLIEYLMRSDELRQSHPRLALAYAVINARIDRDWTQSQLATAAGTKQSRISDIENARGNPCMDTLEKVMAALDIRVDFYSHNPGVDKENLNANGRPRGTSSHTNNGRNGHKP